MLKSFHAREKSLILVTLILFSAGCGQIPSSLSSLGTTPATTTTTTTGTTTVSSQKTNVVGQIFGTSNSSGSHALIAKGKLATTLSHARDQGLSGCSVSISSLTDSAVLATGTTDASGTFVVTNGTLQAGASYKAVGTCGNHKYTAIVGADTTDAATKTPTAVDPTSTLVSVETVKALVTAEHAAMTNTNGLGTTIQGQVAASLLNPASVSQVLASVSNAISTAISTGSMPIPTQANSTGMSTAVAGVASSANVAGSAAALSAVNTAEGNFGTLPVSVSGAVAGAASAASSFPGCDNTQNAAVASVAKCTQAVAKLMFNVLKFPVMILNTGAGAFGSFTCSSGDATLRSAFQNFQTAISSVPNADYCLINATLQSVNRNQSPGEQSGGDNNNGPSFSETGPGIATGVLSAMGSSLFSGTVYRLSDLDSLVFSYNSGTKTGMGVKLLGGVDTASFDSPGNNPSNNWYLSTTYYLLSSTAGATTAAAVSSSVLSATACNSSPCSGNMSDGNNVFNGITFSDPMDFTSGSGGNATFALDLGGSTFSGSPFLAQYGGAIPSAENMQNQIANSMQFQNNNPTGQPQFSVLLTSQPNWQDPNCQYNSGTTVAQPWAPAGTAITPTTQCLDQSGAPDAPITVDVVTGSTNGAGVSPIIQINTPASLGAGRFYLYPFQTGGGFTGLYEFVNTSNGMPLTDELFNQRYILQVLNQDQCSTSPLSSDGSCTVGSMYNVSVTWNCNGQCTATTTVLSLTPINSTGPSRTAPVVAFAPAVEFQINQTQSRNGPGAVGAQVNSNNQTQTVAYAVTIDGTGAVTAACLEGLNGCPASPSHTGNQYTVIQNSNCSCIGTNCNSNPNAVWTCTNNGYYLADSSGNVVVSGTPNSNGNVLDHTALSTPGSTPVGLDKTASNQVCSQNGCVDHVVLYADSYFQGLGSSFFLTGVDSSTKDSWDTVTQTPMIYTGQVANPIYNCALDPFFLSVGGSNTLPFTVDANTGAVTCQTTTFSGSWSVAQAITGSPSGCDPTNHVQGTPTFCWMAPTIAANQKGLVRMNEKNAYTYGDPSSINALLNTAFGPWMDGQHTLSSTTNLNALQGFALVYMMLSGNNHANLPGFVSPQNSPAGMTYNIMMPPVFNGSGTPTQQVLDVNLGIGNSFLSTHH